MHQRTDMKPVQERDVLSALSQRIGGAAAADLQTSLRSVGVPLKTVIQTVVALAQGAGEKAETADRLLETTQTPAPASPATKAKLAEFTKALRSYGLIGAGESDAVIPNGIRFGRFDPKLDNDDPATSGTFAFTAHSGRIKLSIAINHEQREWSFAKERGPEVLAAMYEARGNTYAYRCVAKLLGLEP